MTERGEVIVRRFARESELGILSGGADYFRESVQTLSGEPDIQAAFVYDTRGLLLFSWSTSGSPAAHVPPSLPAPLTERGELRLRGGSDRYRFWKVVSVAAPSPEGEGMLLDAPAPATAARESIGAVMVEVSLDRINAKTRSIVQSSILILTLFLGVGTVVAWFLSRRITAPIKRLASVAEAVAQGDLAQSIETGGDDEVAQLAASFAKMLAELTHSLRQLETINGISMAATRSLRNTRAVLEGILRGMISGLDGAGGALFLRDEHSGGIDEGLHLLRGGKPQTDLSTCQACRSAALRVNDERTPHQGGMDHLGLLAFPVMAGDALVAVVTLYGVVPRLTPRNTSFIDTLSRHSAALIQNARLFNETSRLATAIERSGDSVMVTDPEGRITYVNPAFTETTGYGMAEVIGRTPRFLKSGRHDRGFYESLWRTIKGGSVWKGTVVNRKKDGKYLDEEMTIVPLTDAAGMVINFVAVKSDVTDRENLERARSYFSSVTSHELKTPLTYLSLVLHLLQQRAELEERSAPTLVEAIKVLSESYALFSRTISATTILSRLQAPASQSSLSPVELGALVTMGIGAVQGEADIAGRTVSFALRHPGEVVPLTVMGDAETLQRALMEILRNALQYSPNESTVTVSLEAEGDAGVIRVIDSGIGMSAESLEQVTLPYYSALDPMLHTSGASRFMSSGVGLGLTIAKFAVESFGGTLAIDSQGEGRGTTVTIRMPLREPSGAQEIA